MCFRPPSVEAGKSCSHCGQENEQSATKCVSCGNALPQEELTVPGTPHAPAVAGAPAAPSAPASPVAPKVPGAPGAPKPPKPPQ